jgi:hypothetical protein
LKQEEEDDLKEELESYIYSDRLRSSLNETSDYWYYLQAGYIGEEDEVEEKLILILGDDSGSYELNLTLKLHVTEEAQYYFNQDNEDCTYDKD